MGSARFNFIDKSDPSYNPYGKVYTPRQEKILEEEVPLEEVRLGSYRHRADRNASHERSPKTETDNFGITTPPTQAAVIT